MVTTEATRFSALLNPIRDLAANWGVDVSKELSEYAESLGIQIDEDNDSASETHETTQENSRVDFAHAALLVQGSTSIYSRKVEHLYALVFKAVEYINNVRGEKNAGGNGSDLPCENDADADALMAIDDVQFLDLDNVPVAAPQSISLKESELPPAGSLQDTTCLRPIPPMLVQGNLAGGDNLGRAAYKMLSAHMDTSGAIILDGCPSFGEDLDTLPQRTEIQQQSADNIPERVKANVDGVNVYDDNDFDDGDDDGGDAMFVTPPPMRKSVGADDGDILVGVASSARKRREPQVVPGEPLRRLQRRQDPFLKLDPHDEIPSLNKPMKIGRPYRVPKDISSSATKGLIDSYPSIDDEVSNDRLQPLILGPAPRATALRSYLFNEAVLKRQYGEVLRKRTAAKRRRALRTNRLLEMALVEDSEDMAEDVGRGYAHVTFNDDVDDFGPDDGDDAGDIPHFPPLNDEDDPENAGVDMGDVSGVGNSTGRLSNDLVQLAISYEEACKEHLRKTAWMWEQRTRDEELHQRVENWSSRIKPLLEQEEQRSEFDISAYGQSLLRSFSTENTATPKTRMRVLFQANEKFQVCRMFLATLQLANNYSVAIEADMSGQFSNPSVKLLNGPATITSSTPLKSKSLKRSRQIGTTPRSLRRPPLRPRLDLTPSAR